MSKDKDKEYRKQRKQKHRDAKRAERDRKVRVDSSEFDSFRKCGPYIRKLLHMRGCVLPFYDYVDPYSEEFRKIAEWAHQTYPSLLSVLEVEDAVFESAEDHFDDLGCADLTHLKFNLEGDKGDYGKSTGSANIAGHTMAFRDVSNNLRTLVTIKKSIETSNDHPEFKYVFKIAALCHEIGHVQDIERGLNFRFTADETGELTDIIEAEVYANLFALDLMAKRGLRESYKLLFGGMNDAVLAEGYLGQVARAVIERHVVCEFTDWEKIAFDPPPTAREMRALGPGAAKAFAS